MSVHPAAYAFVSRTVDKHKLNKPNFDLVELGSFNVNGSVRPLFAACGSYVGVDVRDGPGVDHVADAGYFGAAGAYDVVVTTEMLEHAVSPKRVISNAARILKPGGAFVVTAAGPGRAPHGNDGEGVGAEHYQNIDPDDLRSWLEDAGFVHVTVEHNEVDHDVYAAAFMPKGGPR